MPPAQSSIIVASDIAFVFLCIIGAYLLWRWQFNPAARASRIPRVPVIAAPWIYFAGMVLFVFFAWLLTGNMFSLICHWSFPEFSLSTGYAQILRNGVANIGGIAGALYARRFLLILETMPHIAVKKIGLIKPPPPISVPAALAVGAGVFVIVRTLLAPVAIAWDWLLNLLKVPVQNQDLVTMLRNETSAQRIAMITVLAVVIAPIFEEIIFRGAIFGYCRARLPRWLAVIFPSLLFAAVHMDDASNMPNMRSFLPLFILAAILSIAYERTGRIAVPIVAHALFNLSTIIMILLGVVN